MICTCARDARTRGNRSTPTESRYCSCFERDKLAHGFFLSRRLVRAAQAVERARAARRARARRAEPAQVRAAPAAPSVRVGALGCRIVGGAPGGKRAGSAGATRGFC